MKNRKSPLLIVCITILLVLFAQECLFAKSPVFLDVEKETRSCEIKDYNSKKSSLMLYVPGDVIISVLRSPQYFYGFFWIAEIPGCSKISLPLLSKLFNHSPPSLL